MVARLFGLLGLALLAACCQRPVPLPDVPHPPQRVTKIVFEVDVDDAVELCANPTMPMLFRQPTLNGPVCGLTVGELRAWLQRLSRAD